MVIVPGTFVLAGLRQIRTGRIVGVDWKWCWFGVVRREIVKGEPEKISNTSRKI